MPPSKKKTTNREAKPASPAAKTSKAKTSKGSGKSAGSTLPKQTGQLKKQKSDGSKESASKAKTTTAKPVVKSKSAALAPAKTGKKAAKPAAAQTPSSRSLAKSASKPSGKPAATTKPSVAKIVPPSKSPAGKTKPAAGGKKPSSVVADAKKVASKHTRGEGKSVAVSSPSTKKPSPISHPIAARKPAPVPEPKKSNTSPEIVAKIRSAQAEKELRKDLAQTAPKRTLTPITPIPPVSKGQDRIVLMVRDPYWLHAHWDVTRQTVDRAKAALVEHWHSVKPILRLLKLDDSGTTESAENVYRDLEIHGGVRNWYIDVDQPPSRFQIVMGYMTGSGRFYELVRSNTVTTPVPGGKEASDDHWADIAKDAERIYAMSGGYGDETQSGELGEVFEERLNRTMDLDVLSQFGSGAEGGLKRARQFHFDVDAELVVFGSTHPDAHVTIGTEPVKVRSDGTFSIRIPFPDRRQVLPATARSRDGVDEQTVVIAVERNTKVMEPLSLEGEDQ
ncbi:MAG: DUF4912 domain-containing protein [Pirellula sp.]|nr:DUF4912 domain-containing protein [Pirellula sp.]